MKNNLNLKIESFFYISEKNIDDYVFLALGKENSILCSFEKNSNFYNFLETTNFEEFSDVFISKLDDKALRDIISIAKYDSSIQFYISDKFYHKYENINLFHRYCDFNNKKHEHNKVIEFRNLIKSNPSFYIYLVEFSKKYASDFHNANKLISEGLLDTTQGKLDFSYIGNLFFAEKCSYPRSIIVKKINDTKYRQYVDEYRADNPLFSSIAEVCQYIDDQVPKLQSRANFSHLIKKPIDLYSAIKILTFMISYANIDTGLNVIINIYKYGIEFITKSTFEKNSMDKLLKEVFYAPTLNELDELIEHDNINLKIRRAGNRLIMTVFYSSNIFNLDDGNLDEIDHQIISFAKDLNRPFRRAEIDDLIMLSPRTVQMKLMNLVEKGYLKKQGNGKSITYEINENKN